VARNFSPDCTAYIYIYTVCSCVRNKRVVGRLNINFYPRDYKLVSLRIVFISLELRYLLMITDQLVTAELDHKKKSSGPIQAHRAASFLQVAREGHLI
jgi:hypothetical protein